MDRSQETRAIVEAILRVYPAARGIYLFGSRARRTHTPDSDWDILIVTPTDAPPAVRGARARMALTEFDAGFDLIVVTPEEFEKLRGWPSSVVYRALSEGECLHEAA